MTVSEIRRDEGARRAAELVENSVTQPGFLSGFISTDDSTPGINQMGIGSENREITVLRRINVFYKCTLANNFLRYNK